MILTRFSLLFSSFPFLFLFSSLLTAIVVVVVVVDKARNEIKLPGEPVADRTVESLLLTEGQPKRESFSLSLVEKSRDQFNEKQAQRPSMRTFF